MHPGAVTWYSSAGKASKRKISNILVVHDHGVNSPFGWAHFHNIIIVPLVILSVFFSFCGHGTIDRVVKLLLSY